MTEENSIVTSAKFDTTTTNATEAKSAPRRARRAASRPAGPPTATFTEAPQAKTVMSEAAVRAEKKQAEPLGAVVLFQPPDEEAMKPRRRRAASRPAGPPTGSSHDDVDDKKSRASRGQKNFKKQSASTKSASITSPVESTASSEKNDEKATAPESNISDAKNESNETSLGRRRRRGGRGRRRRTSSDNTEAKKTDEKTPDAVDDSKTKASTDGESGESTGSDQEPPADSKTADTKSSRRRRRRRRRSGSDDIADTDDPPNTVTKVRRGRNADDEVTGLKGSTRLEAKRQRRRDGRDSGRRRQSVTEADFLARRESVKRTMVIRENDGRAQIAICEDDILVEHYVARTTQASMIGNVYLGRVQNVLPSMEAAFVDIGRGRNAVLYAGEVNWDITGLEGQPRRIELALKSGDSVLVQVTKDPIGHKGARLTSQISLPGRYLVLVPGGSMTGISRKLPDRERSRLKKTLKKVVPDDAGVIVRTAAEGASEEELQRDVQRLTKQWANIEKKAKAVTAPCALSSEPELTIKVIRDVFNEDFKQLVVSGKKLHTTIMDYVNDMAPDLADRVEKWDKDSDVFESFRLDEQIAKALERKVWLPSGGSLVIDRTEAMTVVDVNTGRFTGSGGNLEATVTKNNLEAAEEIVRQLRLRDIGGIIVVDFIDMVLESNRELVLRRLTECLGRDRTKHQVAEVTSLGLVQMTRKRIGQGLLEAFSEPCPHCAARGVLVHDEPIQQSEQDDVKSKGRTRRNTGRNRASTKKEPGKGNSETSRRKQEGVAAVAAIAAASGKSDNDVVDGDGVDDRVTEISPADDSGVDRSEPESVDQENVATSREITSSDVDQTVDASEDTGATSAIDEPAEGLFGVAVSNASSHTCDTHSASQVSDETVSDADCDERNSVSAAVKTVREPVSSTDSPGRDASDLT